MPSLNLDLDYFTNPKIMRLVGLLGAEGFTIPIRLWCYVAKHHAETGKLEGYSKPEIERVVEWRGDMGRCVEALVSIKLLKRNSQNTYSIHDWREHAGHLIYYKQRAKSAASARWEKYRNASSNALTSHLIPSHPSSLQNNEEKKDCAAALRDSPSSFVELEKGKIPESKNPTSTSQAQASSADYEKAYIAYPNHDGGKDDGWNVWERLRKANKLPALEIILKSIDVHKRGASWKREDGKFIPYFSTWLKGKRWTAEPRPSQPRRLVL